MADDCKVVSRLLDALYVGCHYSTLQDFIINRVKLDSEKLELSDETIDSYMTFLQTIYVVYPCEFDDGHLRQMTGDPAPLLHKLWQSGRAHTGRRSEATSHESFLDLATWTVLGRHVGIRWVQCLYTFCSLFVRTPNRSLFYFYGGRLSVQPDPEVLKMGALQPTCDEPMPAIPIQVKHAPTCEGSDQSVAVGGGERRQGFYADLRRAQSLGDVDHYLTLENSQLKLVWTRLIYNIKSYIGFPECHPVARLNKSKAANGGVELAGTIFSEADLAVIRSTDHVADNQPILLFTLLQELLDNHRNLQFRKMFIANCGDASGSSPCETSQVGSFLAAIVHRVVPLAMFGSKHNKEKVTRFIRDLIHTMTRMDQPDTRQLLRSFRLADCPWIPPTADPAVKSRMAYRFLGWLLLRYLLMPFLPGFFYITERSKCRKKMFYYPKMRFLRMRAEFLEQMVRDGLYEVSGSPPPRGTLATVRLVPKITSLRPVVTVKRTALQANCAKVKASFEPHRRLLRFISGQPRYRGFGLSIGLDEFHLKWRNLLATNGRHREIGARRPLYFVKFDVGNCYPSMNLQQLVTVLEEVATDPLVSGNVLTHHRYRNVLSRVAGRTLTEWRETITKVGDDVLLGTMLDGGGPSNRVVFAQNTSKPVTRALVDEVVSHVTSVVLKVGDKHFRLLRGVCQGDSMSGVLCDLYLSHLERLTLKEFGDRPDELMVRYVDDYLFVTPELGRARRLLDVMCEGVPAYNFAVNPAKTHTNFDHPPANVKQLPPSVPFVWNGLVIDTVTLKINSDYHKYDGQSIADTITFNGASGVEGLRVKMRSLCDARRIISVFDELANCKAWVIENLYQVALFTAFRFHALVSKLPVRDDHTEPLEPAVYVEVVQDCVNNICRTVLREARAGRIRCSLRPVEIRWIGMRAFLLKLRTHSEYRRVVAELTTLTGVLDGKVTRWKRDKWSAMLRVDQMPEVFRQMKERKRPLKRVKLSQLGRRY